MSSVFYSFSEKFFAGQNSGTFQVFARKKKKSVNSFSMRA
jgi:hypothetical protein